MKIFVTCGQISWFFFWWEREENLLQSISKEEEKTTKNGHFFYYTTIPQMTIPRLTKWRPDFHILTIQRLFLLKKRAKFLAYPSRASLKNRFYPSRVLERTFTTSLTGFFYPWWELIFSSLKKLFLTPNWLQIGIKIT